MQIYQTGELTEPVEIVGQVLVELFASSDRLDTDFTAKLCDVYLDERAMLICDGIIRARHRYSMETEELMVPGEIYQMTIDLWETAIVFNTGHRILLAISSSNHPRFDANPNTGDPFMQHDTTLIATNTIYHELGYASRLVIRTPVPWQDAVDADCLAPAPYLIRRLTCTPNPFGSEILIRYELRSPTRADLAVYDVGGRLVRRLLEPATSATQSWSLRWDGTDDRGRPLPGGAYFLRLSTGRTQASRPLLLLR